MLRNKFGVRQLTKNCVISPQAFCRNEVIFLLLSHPYFKSGIYLPRRICCRNDLWIAWSPERRGKVVKLDRPAISYISICKGLFSPIRAERKLIRAEYTRYELKSWKGGWARGCRGWCEERDLKCDPIRLAPLLTESYKEGRPTEVGKQLQMSPTPGLGKMEIRAKAMETLTSF
jgi:hypothetical protein